ncbi:MAG: hypothetical protein GX113_10470 [Actinobacteria bacterium]|jgi:hypothetical protein|nr:hypothetical protein [Actinomycetota bacterium]
MTTTLALVLALAVLVVAAVYLPRYRLRKAMRQVVSLFRAQGATSPKTAKTLEELGLAKSGNPFDSLFKPRDYRPYALRALGQADVLRPGPQGSLYLSEEELDRSPLKGFARIE